MLLGKSITGIVISQKTGHSTIKLSNGAEVKADDTNIKLGAKVIVAMDLQTGEVANVYLTGTYLQEPEENQPPEEEYFGFYEED